ncbi:MAG: metallophosphoesterase [Verrucomicrobiota bacterium]
MKHTLLLFAALMLAPLAALNADEPTPPASSAASRPGIDRIWLGHRSHDPGKLVVNWMTEDPGDSIVRFGRTANYGQEVRVSNNATIHHVEIPLEETGGVYHYSVQTGSQSSKDATFKAYPADELRVAVASDWQGLPDLSAIKSDDVHLLLTAGDQISNTHQLCGPGNKECVEPYGRLIDRYPNLFRSVPFMPVLGNHDKEMRPRGRKPPEESVYDIEATAFRQFFELPGDEWKWHFDVPGFEVRFAALDLHHISDLGTTWQSCYAFGKDSEQFRWYDELMHDQTRKFVVTLYNERNASMRTQAQGAWHSMFRKGTIAITGFGYYAERAEVDGFTYYNSALNGRANQYPDPKSVFLKGADSYILLTLTKNPAKMVVEIKGLDGTVMDRKVYQ